MKKIFHKNKNDIEEILKIERKIKTEKTIDGYLVTKGPNDIFKLIFSTMNMINNVRIKPLLEQFFYVIKECIIFYLVGLDCVIEVKLF